MSTSRAAEPPGLVLETGWSAPYGVLLLPADAVRRGFAIGVKRSVAALLGLPADRLSPAAHAIADVRAPESPDGDGNGPL